jgi:REP-associated tyrosine transposase
MLDYYLLMVGDIVHMFNRGVEKRKIFLDDQDYSRFVDNLFLLNNKKGKIRTRNKEIFKSQNLIPEREKMVEILKWSLLPNHYHILLYEKVDGGILEFSKRLGNAYTKYFNTRNEGRSGYIFQSKVKRVQVTNNPQLIYIPFYVDLNPLDLVFPNWENNPLYNQEKAFNFLKTYKWSSFSDSFGNGNRQPIINNELFYDLFDTNPIAYEKEILDFVRQPRVNLRG